LSSSGAVAPDAAQKLTVVGRSWGGGIACRLAALYPDLIDRLVLIAPALAPSRMAALGLQKSLANRPIQLFVSDKCSRICTDLHHIALHSLLRPFIHLFVYLVLIVG
jgi:pimeloyl-ACP methyl ester carboxylesterase